MDGSLPKKVSKPVSEIRNFNCRSICNPHISPSDQICWMKIRSIQHRNTWNVNFLGRVSHFDSFPHALNQIQQEQVTPVTLITPCWHRNTLVIPTDIGHASKAINSHTKFKQIISRSNRETTPINTEQDSNNSDMVGLG